jgi:hypothetical protein
MGVFTKHWKKKVEEEPFVEQPPTPEEPQKPSQPIIVAKRCFLQHTWDGKVLTVNGDLHQVQHPQYIGKPCDCGKFIWNEGLCGCPGRKHWEAKMIENENYGG